MKLAKKLLFVALVPMLAFCLFMPKILYANVISCMININATLSRVLENKEIPLFDSAYGNLPEDTFPEKIYKLRMVNGFSRVKFAAMSDVHVSTIQGWEKGTKIPTKTSLHKICAALGLPISYFAEIT